jgi:hypothetical protein
LWLESVIFEIGSKLEQIRELAFERSGLKWIEIPASVKVIAPSAFFEIGPSSVSISGDSERFRIRESFLENADHTIVYRYFGDDCSLVIPFEINVLGQSSFAKYMSIESVLFESGSKLERIEAAAFAHSGLKSILIPSSVIILNNSSFADCSQLKSVLFESDSKLKRIEVSAFARTGLEQIVIPLSVTHLGNSSFADCADLEKVIFENNSMMEEIDESAFSGCTGLKEIVKPMVVSIGGADFLNLSRNEPE